MSRARFQGSWFISGLQDTLDHIAGVAPRLLEANEELSSFRLDRAIFNFEYSHSSLPLSMI
jgi:hypothetical protein